MRSTSNSGTKIGGLAADALRVDDRSLVGEEPEAGEVLDVVGAEEDVARAVLTPNVLEQPFAAPRELCGRDAGERVGLLLHRASLSASIGTYFGKIARLTSV